MENFLRLFFLLLCIYQALASPPPVDLAAAAPSRADAAIRAPVDFAAAAPSLAEAKVQNLAQISADANQVLSAAEKSMGRSIISKLDSILIDPNDRRPGPPSCLNKVDLMLILDSSGSIGASEFGKGISASKTLVDYIDFRCPISRYGSQVGLIEFSTPHQTHTVFSLGVHTSKWAVDSAIDRVVYDNGYSTATANALRLAKTEINQHGRISNAKVAWVLTDGNSNTGGDPRVAAGDLKGMGVTVCAVAIGNSINMAEINDIASSGCVYRASSFTRYDKIMEFAAAEARGSSQHSPVLDPNFFSGINFH